MKKVAIRVALLMVVFAAVFAGVYFYQNRKPDEQMVQMDKASLPVVYMVYGGNRLNGLHGYTQQMSAASMRDSLTPIDNERNVKISVDTYGNRLTGISYEVRSLNEERLLEKTSVGQWDIKDGVVETEFRLENLIESGEEYLLTIRLTTEEHADIMYYTRILMGMEQVEEKLAYALDFSNKTFQKDEAESLIMYLESGSKGDNTNFGNVNIYSSFSQITWGDLAPVKTSAPIPTITEVNGEITSIRLDYQVQIKNMYGTTEICNVSEFFRTNYTPDRTYLLTYERKMNQKFRAVSENVTSSRINVGISESTDIPFLTSEDGTITAFAKERELWKYNRSSNSLECVFSFRDVADDGIRDDWNQHEIRPVQVEDDGDLYFVVYGYMNRGSHEGNVGVSLYRYYAEEQSVEEVFFLPYNKSFAYLKESMGELFYITQGNHFCFLLESNLYSVDLASLEYVKLVENLTEDCYVINGAGNTIALQTEQDIFKATQIKRLELDTNKEYTITAEEGSLQVVGFIDDDLVYGNVLPENIRHTITGDVRAYMSRLYIVDKNNRQVGKYDKEGYYFTEAVIEENMITLTRCQKTEEGEFVDAPQDYITNNTGSGKTGISVTMIATELKKKEAGINLQANTTGKTLNLDYAREVIYPEGRLLTIESTAETEVYYVYAKGKLMEVLNHVSEAIQLADEQVGVVIGSDGSYIWRRGNQNTSKTLSVTMPETEGLSLAKALDAMMRYAGVSADSAAKLEAGMLPMEIMNESMKKQCFDLTGCSLRQVLYFVDQGRPVLARVAEDEYVLVVGFDAYNALLLDTSGEKAYKIGLEDGTKLFREAGNEFIAYAQ